MQQLKKESLKVRAELCCESENVNLSCAGRT
jgi:hypothetical protein